MDNIRIGILEPTDFSLKAEECLKKIGYVEKYVGGNLYDFISDKTVLFVRLGYNIDNEFLKYAPKLKYICSPTTGLNHISVKKEIDVISLKGEEEFLKTIRATPEHIFGLSLSLIRNYKMAFLSMSNDEWDREKFRGLELFENKVGIIGFGRVGRILCKYYNAFDAEVFYYDINDLIVSDDATQVNSMEELIDLSNIVILCADYREKNKHMINATHFKLLKNKFFINAARGELINENDLIDFINEDKYLGVGIDVLANEAKGPVLLNHLLKVSEDKNVIITPHIGGATFTSMKRTEEYVARCLLNKISLDKNFQLINDGEKNLLLR